MGNCKLYGWILSLIIISFFIVNPSLATGFGDFDEQGNINHTAGTDFIVEIPTNIGAATGSAVTTSPLTIFPGSLERMRILYGEDAAKLFSILLTIEKIGYTILFGMWLYQEGQEFFEKLESHS